ncbi:hypothetical protein ACTOB_006203 [Actinoplanes oblitus]|uniref:Uncharacterized protein n=1 Tax=Actinoplanes oblitus TaxID=3040509 RepID=A0ABY8WEN7_9ACTN|nr:hypothetical protein [Actinoplanes oblitus]WIM94200.1 hypothetical protein ACTOB_006203 [Actinoplanes oblitus]
MVSHRNGRRDLVLYVTVPAGATSMVVKFRYHDAANNWYWVIDDLRVG